jgi:prepilin signal peptidase PulO-like enzyme (type II secretory pathway)
MIPGIDAATFTLAHVTLSLASIGAGFAVVFGLLTARRLPFWTALFFTAATLTCLTGFLFPFRGMTLSLEMEIPTLAFLMVAAVGRYRRDLAGAWRPTYVVCVMAALYFSVVVVVEQIFEWLLPPTARAPQRPGLPLTLTQVAVFAIFALVTPLALKRFHGTTVHRL